uniref:TBC1 domain family, member 22B n=1 Tax=Myripristis murdjan TaxID=586833 RepID=A0A667X0Y4_9TELE
KDLETTCIIDSISCLILYSIQPVYGAHTMSLHGFNNLKSKKASSFHEFARSTNDAWDIDDEEDEDFLGAPAPPSSLPSGRHSTHHQVCEDEAECEQVNGRVVKSSSEAHLNTIRSTLQKQQSLPVRPIIPLVARISDQNASGAPPMTVREKSRLDKFKQLLASPNTDLEELRKHSWSGIPREVRPITWRLLSVSPMTSDFATSHAPLCNLAERAAFCDLTPLR